jgi:hypothetical protein
MNGIEVRFIPSTEHYASAPLNAVRRESLIQIIYQVILIVYTIHACHHPLHLRTLDSGLPLTEPARVIDTGTRR